MSVNKLNIPTLAAWKEAMSLLDSGKGLSAEDIKKLTDEGKEIKWPWITPFEQEQLQDVCSKLNSLEALLILGNTLSQKDKKIDLTVYVKLLELSLKDESSKLSLGLGEDKKIFNSSPKIILALFKGLNIKSLQEIMGEKPQAYIPNFKKYEAIYKHVGRENYQKDIVSAWCLHITSSQESCNLQQVINSFKLLIAFLEKEKNKKTFSLSSIKITIQKLLKCISISLFESVSSSHELQQLKDFIILLNNHNHNHNHNHNANDYLKEGFAIWKQDIDSGKIVDIPKRIDDLFEFYKKNSIPLEATNKIRLINEFLKNKCHDEGLSASDIVHAIQWGNKHFLQLKSLTKDDINLDNQTNLMKRLLTQVISETNKILAELMDTKVAAEQFINIFGDKALQNIDALLIDCDVAQSPEIQEKSHNTEHHKELALNLITDYPNIAKFLCADIERFYEQTGTDKLVLDILMLLEEPTSQEAKRLDAKQLFDKLLDKSCSKQYEDEANVPLLHLCYRLRSRDTKKDYWHKIADEIDKIIDIQPRLINTLKIENTNIIPALCLWTFMRGNNIGNVIYKGVILGLRNRKNKNLEAYSTQLTSNEWWDALGNTINIIMVNSTKSDKKNLNEKMSLVFSILQDTEMEIAETWWLNFVNVENEFKKEAILSRKSNNRQTKPYFSAN